MKIIEEPAKIQIEHTRSNYSPKLNRKEQKKYIKSFCDVNDKIEHISRKDNLSLERCRRSSDNKYNLDDSHLLPYNTRKKTPNKGSATSRALPPAINKIKSFAIFGNILVKR